MRIGSVAAASVLMFCVACGGDGADDPESYCERVQDWSVAWGALEDEVLVLTNQRRTAGATCGTTGFGPASQVAADPLLRCAARNHSRAMSQGDFFDHTDPDGDGPTERVERAGYAWSGVAENIAAGQTTASSVVQAWMTSPGHCGVIMDPDLSQLGVGYYRPQGGAPMWTQVFGTPW